MRGKSSEVCFDCLEKRIKSDFSDEIVFSHGISDSPLPFGSSAVVEVPDSSGGFSASAFDSTSSHFILEYLPKEEHVCLANYVERFGVADSNDAVESEVYLDCSPSVSKAKEDDERELGTENMTCGSFSCRKTISALLPIAQISECSVSGLQKLASSFISECPEDQVLASLYSMIDGKSSGEEAESFLRLLGLPLLEDKSKFRGLRHPNLLPVLGFLTSTDCVVSVLPKPLYTLENILHYSAGALKSDWHRNFMIYQLLSALAHLHGLKISHGDIRPSNILLSDSLWCWLKIYNKHDLGSGDVNSSDSGRRLCVEGCYSHELYADLKISSHWDWQIHFDKWWRGDVSNFEYLLFLNKLAGRRWGDHTFHPIMPWVIDFSQKPENDSELGWRDLRKSKWRLAKGDEQLDFTYSTFEIPHHISDECLSELAVCSYKARRLPLSVLRKAVRSVYEPNEYPSDMLRLYDWTPDECIPEFYCDPHIFFSIHPSMSDLAVPPWASTPEEFIRLHRDALESPHVSSLIHHWIDITFGYKMSGQAAITAKNVMLSSSEPTVMKSVGRRQLFSRPHPVRLGFSREKEQSRNELEMHTFHGFGVDNKRSVVLQADEYLEETEEASAFSFHATHLSPQYHLHQNLAESPLHELSENTSKADTSLPGNLKNKGLSSNISLNYLLEHIEVRDEASTELEELLLWRQDFCIGNLSKDIAGDIFSIGCVLAELYLMKPLFNSVSLAAYLEGGDLPKLIKELPPPTQVLVEACIEQDWRRRPSAKSLLDSPYFSAPVKSAYLFAAPLHLLAKSGTRLCYAASFAKQGALKAMGTFVAEKCAAFCLPLVTTPLSDSECELAYVLLKEFTKSLNTTAVQRLILPSVQRILLTTGYSHLKVSLLQDSFVRELWNHIGKRIYLEMVHPLVISNLYNSPDKVTASAASVLLIGSSEELGAPVTVHQTILPLINYFGKGICTDGIDVLVRIGRLLGLNFIVKQMMPLLEHVVCVCIDLSSMKKPEPVHSWCSLALTDCLITLDGVVALIPDDLLIHELTKGRLCLHVRVLMQKNLEFLVLQFAATSLMSICQRIGQELTAKHVLPQLKELFNEFAFSEKSTDPSDSLNSKIRTTEHNLNPESPIKSHMDLVLLLYPSFASLLGMEILRQGCPTWLLLEQYLLKHHNWKWEYRGQTSRYSMEAVLNKGIASKHTPKMLLNGSGRSVPQSQGLRNPNDLKPQIHVPVEEQEADLNPLAHEPWSWFPSPVACWDGLDIGRFGNLKDEHRWKIRASVLSSVHAHHGALRSLVVSEDECTVFTSGIDPGFKGSVQKWELASLSCVSGYHGHEEVVNDISILSTTGKIASCDGTIHVWNSQTGKLISLFSESPTDHEQASSYPSSVNNSNQSNRHVSQGLSSEIFDGNLYTCMHYLEYMDQLVVGTGSGALRFIDLGKGQKLQLWRGVPVESGFTSLVSALCSGGSQTKHGDSVLPSWIATGYSSGQCRLFDVRESGIISSWRAHRGYVTKLAAPESHLLVSSSLDKTLRIWDLRKSWAPQPFVVRRHDDGVSGFSIMGKDIISISRNNIGVFSMPNSQDEQQRIIPQKLYTAEKGGRIRTDLSTICVLPFSRLFVVGAHDGYFRICC
ncbi:unnamed protein product [Cochlearia groenlandica]